MRGKAHVRVSTEGQADEGASIDDQKARIIEACEQEGFELLETVDEGAKSGFNTQERDGFNRLLEEAESGLYDVLVTYDLERFGRDSLDKITAFNRLRHAGVKLFTVKDGFVTYDSFEDAILFLMKSTMGDFPKRREIERSKEVLQMLHALGHPCQLAPYGYMQGEKGAWVPDPELAPKARKAWKLRAKGKSYTDISRKTGIARGTLCGMFNRNSRCYTGFYKRKGEWHQGSFKPLVDKEMWEKAVAICPRFGFKSRCGANKQEVKI